MVLSAVVTSSVVVPIGEHFSAAASGGIIATVNGRILVELALVLEMDRSIFRTVTAATAYLIIAGIIGTGAIVFPF